MSEHQHNPNQHRMRRVDCDSCALVFERRTGSLQIQRLARTHAGENPTHTCTVYLWREGQWQRQYHERGWKALERIRIEGALHRSIASELEVAGFAPVRDDYGTYRKDAS